MVDEPKWVKWAGPGVGMPASLYLDEFGSQVWHAFGHPCYLVGSALRSKQWRDVDVRLILSDEEYDAMGFGDPRQSHSNGKWVAMTMAFSALGRAMTGLPIDFQIQQQTEANREYNDERSCLGMTALRLKQSDEWNDIEQMIDTLENCTDPTSGVDIQAAAKKTLDELKAYGNYRDRRRG